MGIFLLCSVYSLAIVAKESHVVVINTSHVINTVPSLMNGAHFSPLNHQVQVLLANMMFDESFEQTPLNGCSINGADRSERAGLCACGSPGCISPPLPSKYGNYQNHSWVLKPGASDVTEGAEYIIEPWCSSPEGGANASHCSYNGNVSLRLGPKAAVVNRGLYQQGFVFKQQRYDGYLFVRSAGPVTLRVSIDDDGTSLATAALTHSGGNWTRLNFSLTPSHSTKQCVDFPAGTPPLWCSCSAEECNTCIRCGGELSIVLEEGSSADIDYVSLSPAAELLPGAPMVNRLPIELAGSMGHSMLRYGGTVYE
jgi:hypothetical protein